MAVSELELTPELSVWIQAREREAELTRAIAELSTDRVAEQDKNRRETLDAIQKRTNPDQHENLSFLVDYLSTPKEARTDNDTRQFKITLGSLFDDFGPHAGSIYLAWERKPQTPQEE